MTLIVYHSDEGHRKGCHPVTLVHEGKKTTESHIFSIDEPGAWYEHKWNCHVDGTDYPFDTREQCIAWGLQVLGYLSYEVDPPKVHPY